MVVHVIYSSTLKAVWLSQTKKDIKSLGEETKAGHMTGSNQLSNLKHFYGFNCVRIGVVALPLCPQAGFST